MTPPFSDFVDMVAALQDAGAEFVVVGGHAVAFHGSARATKDIDIFLNPTPENAARVVRALHLFGAPVVALGITEDDFAHPGSVVQLGVPPVRIALLTRIDGVSFEEVGRTVQEIPFGALAAPVIGLDALLKNKRASGRPQDLADVDALTRR